MRYWGGRGKEESGTNLGAMTCPEDRQSVVGWKRRGKIGERNGDRGGVQKDERD